MNPQDLDLAAEVQQSPLRPLQGSLMQFNAAFVKQDGVTRKKKKAIREETADSHSSACKSVLCLITLNLVLSPKKAQH